MVRPLLWNLFYNEEQYMCIYINNSNVGYSYYLDCMLFGLVNACVQNVVLFILNIVIIYIHTYLRSTGTFIIGRYIASKHCGRKCLYSLMPSLPRNSRRCFAFCVCLHFETSFLLLKFVSSTIDGFLWLKRGRELRNI